VFGFDEKTRGTRLDGRTGVRVVLSTYLRVSGSDYTTEIATIFDV